MRHTYFYLDVQKWKWWKWKWSVAGIFKPFPFPGHFHFQCQTISISTISENVIFRMGYFGPIFLFFGAANRLRFARNVDFCVFRGVGGNLEGYVVVRNFPGGNGNGNDVEMEMEILEMEILEMEMFFWKWKWSKSAFISISGHLRQICKT